MVGKSGKPGFPGQPGPNGSPGFKGIVGDDGYDGRDGEKGEPGLQGYQGWFSCYSVCACLNALYKSMLSLMLVRFNLLMDNWISSTDISAGEKSGTAHSAY